MEPDIVLIDMRTCELTMAQVMDEIKRLKQEYPDHEIIMDGDAYAIVARRKQRWDAAGSP